MAGTVTASGLYTGNPVGTGGAPELPVPEIQASDYLAYADVILTSDGTMTNQAGTEELCPAAPCNNWDFAGSVWSFGTQAPTDGTYYVEGAVEITGSPGSSEDPVLMSIIAEGSIDISGSPAVTPHTPDLLFVTDGDLKISGNIVTGDPATAEGQMLVHEQVQLSGTPSLAWQLIVENATSVDLLVTDNAIVSGNVTITYDGDLGGDTFSVRGWRDVRDAD